MLLEQALASIGLEEKEAKVYLAALELGPATIQAITKKSSIKRSTVYGILVHLKAQGLISETIHGKSKLMIAAEPKKLIETIRTKEHLLREILPELNSINNTGTVKPKISFYEGTEGLREIFKDTLNTTEKMTFWISPIQSINETVGEDFLNKYVEERTKRGLWVKSIHITSHNANYKYLEPQHHEKTLRKIRFTPVEIDIPNTIAIYGDKVAVMSARKESFGFVVESKGYAQTMKTLHDVLWSISKPYGDMNFDSKQTTDETKDEEKDDDYWSVK